MKTRPWHFLFLVFIFCGISAAAYASYPPTVSHSRVPRADWTYDALALFAARGMIPGKEARHFYGDWLYTRKEMADFVSIAVRQLAEAPDEYKIRRPLAARLIKEFQPEIDQMGLPQGEIDKALRGVDDSSLSALAVSGRFYFSDSKDGGGSRLDFAADRETFIGGQGMVSLPFVLSYSNQREEFRSQPGSFPRLQNSFIHGKYHEWDWKIGQEYMWWGPGYSGSMTLSDNAPPFPFFKFGKDFSLGKRIGRLRVDELLGSYDDFGERFYFVGRRFEKTLSKQWNVALNETAKMQDRPNPLILVIPSLYLYQQIYLDEVDEKYNTFLSLEASYQFDENSSAYLEYLIDDMTAPFKSLQGFGKRPRRIGWLAGIHRPFNEGTSLRAEVILTDIGTYVSARPEYPQLSYTHDGFYLGHPVGPNSLALFLRAEHKLSSSLDGVVEYLWREARDASGPNPEDQTSYNAFLSYGIKNHTALWLRVQKLLGDSTDRRTLMGISYTF